MATKQYTIADGDTLESIASRNGTNAQDLAALNNMNATDTLLTGNTLNLPDTTPEAASAPAVQQPQTYQSGKWYTGANTSSGNTASILASIEGGIGPYEQSQAVKDAYNQLYEYEQNKPGEYESKYSAQIDELLNNILNREDFRYDVSDDPLYEMYRQQYEREGKRAMQDTMANAASLSGGYDNSYANTVGQQQYQYYLSQLTDKVPELYREARDAYDDEGNKMYQNLSMLRDADQADYGMYRDTIQDYYNDLSYYYTKYQDMSKQEYEAYQNDLALWQKDRDYWYGKYQNELALAAARSGGGGGGTGGGSPSGGYDWDWYNSMLSTISKIKSGKLDAKMNVSANVEVAKRRLKANQISQSMYNTIYNKLNSL